MKFICRIIEKTKLFPLTVMSLYYMKTFLLYSMWSTFTAQLLHLWCLLDKYILVQMYKPCTILIPVQSNRKNRNNQKAMPIFLPGFQNILLHACNKTFYHASLLGINTLSFFLAILIFFLIIIHRVIFNFRIVLACCALNRSREVSVLSASCFSLCQKVILFNTGYFTPCVSDGRSGTEHHHCIFT